MKVIRTNDYTISNSIVINDPIRVSNTLGDMMNALLEISAQGLPDSSALRIEFSDKRELSFEVSAMWHEAKTVSGPAQSELAIADTAERD
jgi:hypothetical protein